jgi:hypothetical protein
MIKDGIVLPELLDEVLNYLDRNNIRSDIHRCLFVNRQFYEQAKSVLYTDLRFCPYGQKCSRDDELWVQLYHNNNLMSHTKSLDIEMMSGDSEALHGDLPPFQDRVEFFLHHALNLRCVNLFTMHWSRDYQVLIDIFDSLRKAQITPEVSLDLDEHDNPEGQLSQELIEQAEAMLQIRQKPKLVSLCFDILFYSRKWIEFCPQLLQLSYLSLVGFCDKGPASSDRPAGDLDGIFKNIPLESLSIDCPGIIQSFPSTLRFLSLRSSKCDSDHSLHTTTWDAVCDLRDLVDLQLMYGNLDAAWQGFAPRFKSRKLERFVTVPANSSKNAAFAQCILRPILAASDHLFSLEFTFPEQLFWSLVLPFSTPSTSLSQLEICDSQENNYLFRDLIGYLKNFPNLRDFTLPWPIRRNILGRSTRSVPEKLTFAECSTLATVCPKLNQIMFQIDVDDYSLRGYAYSKWKEYLLARQLMSMPFDSDLIGEWWTLIQSYKMAAFIDKTSPCLNVCTVYFHYGHKDHLSETSSSDCEKITLVLLLKQVQNHTNHS